MIPNDLVPYLDDPREIGIAIREVVVRGPSHRCEYVADHVALVRGWHAPERQGRSLWRWTNGRGVLPIEGTYRGPLIVEVLVSDTTTYMLHAARPGDDVRAAG